VPDEIGLLRTFRDEMPGPSTDAWARARAAVAVAQSEEHLAGQQPRRRAGRRWFSITAREPWPPPWPGWWPRC
jgi:hypothetical protein